MYKVKSAVAGLAVSLCMLSGVVNAQSDEPIKIATHNWSSQIVMSHVLGNIFESLGYNVEYVPSEVQTAYESIRAGDLHVQSEVWQSTMAAPFYAAMEKGGIIDAGDHNTQTFEEMGFPNWVLDKDLCPGLPNWEALKDCSANFATPDSDGKGRWLEGPQSWHGDVMPNRLKGLGLDDTWTVKFAGAADALWAELQAAEKEGRGTIIFNWSPNFTDATGFTFIEFPPYYEGCRVADGGDGACGSPIGWLKKAAHYKMPKTHPLAYRALVKLAFTATHIGEMAALVDTEGMTHADAGAKWVADNADVWGAMIQ